MTLDTYQNEADKEAYKEAYIRFLKNIYDFTTGFEARTISDEYKRLRKLDKIECLQPREKYQRSDFVLTKDEKIKIIEENYPEYLI